MVHRLTTIKCKRVQPRCCSLCFVFGHILFAEIANVAPAEAKVDQQVTRMDQQSELGFAEAQCMSVTISAFQPAAYTNLQHAKAERFKKALELEDQSGRVLRGLCKEVLWVMKQQTT